MRHDAAEIARLSADALWAEDKASQALGMRIEKVGPGHAVLSMTVGVDMVNGHGLCHGGYIFALADSTFALVCNSPGALTVAAGADIDFVAAARAGEVLVAAGRTRAAYGRSGLTDVTVTREGDGAVVAEFRGRSRTLR